MTNFDKFKSIAEIIARRFFSGFIDYSFWFFFPIVLIIASGLPDHAKMPHEDFVFWGCISLWSLFWILTLLGLATRGQTPGQFLLKLQTTRKKGQKAPLLLSFFVRVLIPFFLVAFLILFWQFHLALIIILVDHFFILFPGNRCLHDHLSMTYVEPFQRTVSSR